MSKKKKVVTCVTCGAKVRTTADSKGYRCIDCRESNVKAKPVEATSKKAGSLTDAEKTTLKTFYDQLEAMKPVFADLEKYNPGGYKRFEISARFADRLQKKIDLIAAM